MSYVIAEPCIDKSDQSCVAACPVDCIGADQLPIEWASFAGIDATWYRDPEMARDAASRWQPAA